MKNEKYILKTLILLLILIIGFNYANSFANENKQKIMVSLGDSYSSGEGNSPYYGIYNEQGEIDRNKDNQDWLGHRSKDSWPGRLKINTNTKMKDLKDEYWFFKATSGAETKHMTESYEKTFRNNNGDEETGIVDPQLQVFDELDKKNLKADYITITIGGNDVGFSDIVTTAVMKNSHKQPNLLRDKLNNTWKSFHDKNGIKYNIYQAYRKIREKAGEKANIIVAGYPELFSTKGGKIVIFSVDENEANLINENVNKFNRAIKEIVTIAKEEGSKISFVDVEEAFKNRGAYAENSYIHKVKLGAADQELNWGFMKPSPTSIHPNRYGISAYASCVQERIDLLEGDNLDPNLSSEALNTKFETKKENKLDKTYKKLYKDILQSKKTYVVDKVLNKNGRGYINKIYGDRNVDFALYKHKDFEYPLLILRNTITEMKVYAIVQCEKNGKYYTFSEIDPHQSSTFSNDIYYDEKGNLYLDDIHREQIVRIDKIEGRLQTNYAISPEGRGYARRIKHDDFSKNTSNKSKQKLNWKEGEKGVYDISIQENTKEPFSKEKYSRFKKSLKTIKMYPINQMNEVLGKFE